MKLTKKLKMVSIVVPGLLALPAGASWWPNSNASGPGFHADADTSGYTYAKYDRSGYAISLTWQSYALIRGGSGDPYYVSQGGGTVSLHVESYTWEEGCYTYGYSDVNGGGNGIGYASVTSSY